MFHIIKQHQFRLDRGVRDANQADAKMWIPSAFSGRSGVKENRGSLPVDERPVTVAKHDEIDLRVGRSPCGFQGSLAMMAMQEEHNPSPNFDSHTVRERLDEVKWI